MQELIGNYKIITLCGSTKFKDQFIAEQKRLTLEGNIVISVGLFGHTGDEEVWLEKTKVMLDDMHKRKIDLADEIFVINVGGYIGSSTRSEIEYAIKTNKFRKVSGLTGCCRSCAIHTNMDCPFVPSNILPFEPLFAFAPLRHWAVMP
jgi:hypothetical protein